MSTTTENQVRERLDIPTHDLSRVEREALLKLAQELVTRLTCECDMVALGWTIPTDRASAEYAELFAAWLDDQTPRRPR